MASFRSTASVVASFLLKSARNRVITSDARLPSRMVRRAVSRAPSTFGGSAASIRRHVLALVMMPDSGWLTSCAIDAVNAPRLVDPGDVCELRASLLERLFREPALPSRPEPLRCNSSPPVLYLGSPCATARRYLTEPSGISSRIS